MALARKKSEREFTKRHKTSYSANTFLHVDVGSHPNVDSRNASAEREGLRTTPPEPIKETSGVLEMDRA